MNSNDGPPSQDQAPSRRARILVVDDDPSLRELNARLLSRFGCEVDLAKDGVEAWCALKEDRYDLLITDHQMPWVTGLELIQKLRSEAMTLPVILVSGAVPTEELNLLPGLDIQAVMTKSCPLESFLKTVGELLAATGLALAVSDPSPDGSRPPGLMGRSGECSPG